MLKDYLIAIAAGIASALLWYLATLYVHTGANPFPASVTVLLASLPIFFLGLRSGLFPLFAAGATAAVLGSLLTASLWFAIPYAVAIVFPAALATRYALLNRTNPQGVVEWYPAGRLYAILAVYAAALFVIAAAAFAGHDGGLVGYLIDQFTTFYGEALQASPENAGIPIEEMLGVFVYSMVVAAPGGSILLLGIALLLAQAILERLGKARRPTFDFVNLELPRWLSYAVAGMLLLTFVGPGQAGFIGAGLAVVFTVPFFFLGIAVAHNLARRVSGGVIGLIILYALLFFAQPFSMIAVAALGLAEQWIMLRRRFGGGGAGPGGGRDLTRQE